MLEGWKGTAVIIAALALLGVLVWLKVPEAAVAAVSIVSILIAWVTKGPASKDPPPPGAHLVPWIAMGAVVSCLVAQGCSRGSVPPADLPCEPEVYGAGLTACNAAAKNLRASIMCENYWRVRCGRPLRELPDAGADS